MKKITLSVITLSAILASLPAQASCTLSYNRQTRSLTVAQNFSNLQGVKFVRSGRDSGYYVVSPEGLGAKALGLQNAPYRNSDNVSHNGEGSDSIVFRFGPDGKLDGYPMYISQFSPESFYTTRLQGLTAGHSTLGLVQDLFADHAMHIEKQGSQTLAYLEVPVYDSLTSGS